MTSQDQSTTPASTSAAGQAAMQAASPGATVADIGDHDFADAITGRYTAVDLWAPWCGPCRRFMPSFERIAAEHAQSGSPIAFARVNVDDNPVTAAAMAVHSIPTVILFGPDGTEVTRTTGVPNADDLLALLSHADGPPS